MANGRTGMVFLRDFDEGIIRTMGAELIDYELDGETVQVYALRVDEVNGPDQYGGYIPVIWQNPEDVYQENLLPHVVISRTSITQAMARWFPGGREYMTRAAVATDKTVQATGQVMPSHVEIKRWAYPYDIAYEIHLRARLRWQADKMLRHVGRKFWAYGQIYLTDSEGEERGYYAFQESVDSLDEVADIADRLVGWTISVRCEGELDFNDPYIAPTSQDVVTNVSSRSTTEVG
jgi:hypothetical protein